ncbi:uncharacterized protein LOC128214272 isoform X2 [Mya arenaria]|uniref:uncharacterized protein LOC128214272 isoform X2 n=1 Tax=Mya arenaria TaxID=6604 RepID=UPI0022E89493|nr:uncharacterized protein LOC128214272 isoform X2 [Mya arenaria]
MRPPVELNRPTLLNLVAIVCYCLAILFHIIAYATNSWSSLVLAGTRWEMGLWQGCREANGSWMCTNEIFEDEVFQSGSDWHVGSQVMMTLALILLFLLEFVLLGYVCIHRFQKYKNKLVAFIIGLSVSAAFSHFLVLIMYGSEVSKVPESHVKGSYGVIVISLIIELALPLIIHIDKTKKFPLRDVFFKTGSKQPKSANDKPDSSNRRSRPGVVNMRTNPVSSIEDQAAGFRTSVTSLSEAETFKKFAFYENPGMNPSTVSLASYSSVNARTAAYTNTPNLAETSSLESGV